MKEHYSDYCFRKCFIRVKLKHDDAKRKILFPDGTIMSYI